MIDVIPERYQVLAGAAVIVVGLTVAAAAGHHVGAMGVEADWTRDKLAREQAEKRAVLAAVAKNEKDRQADLAVTRATLANYQRSLSHAEERIVAERAAADRMRLRIAVPTRMCAVAGIAEAASPIAADGAGASEEVELPEAVERGLRDVAESADRETERLRAKVTALQDWAHKHGFYELKL